LNSIWIQETLLPPEAKPAYQNGALLRQTPGQRLNRFADISGFEFANDPDGQGPDSNPYAVLALRKRVLVADAAGNSILSVDRKGNVSLFAVLPNITNGLCAGVPNDAGTTGCDAVPTSLALGPNGHIYVGGLGAETPGAGRVWELDPKTGAILKTHGGLFTVTGVAVGKDGSIYASELFGGDPNAEVPGQLTKIKPNGDRKSIAVPFPAGVAVDNKHRVYVAAFSVAPWTGLGVPGLDTSGQIWRLRL
jgi:sugar lactone lactonase YvrE